MEDDIDYDLVSQALIYLEECGWSELIDERWKNDVIDNIREKFPDIDESTLNCVLDTVIY